MKEKLRVQVNTLAQTINNKKRLLFQKLEKDEFEDAARLRDEIHLKQKVLLKLLKMNQSLTYNIVKK